MQNYDPVVAVWVTRALGRLWCTMALLLGLAIIGGGEPRFSGPSFAAAMTYPGAPYSWAALLAIPGLVGLACSLAGIVKATRWCLFVIGTWCLFFTGSLLHAWFVSPVAAATGPFIYATAALTAIILGIAHEPKGR